MELRFYNDKERSFHPKSYIFHYENMSEIYIGSSNIFRSALTSGIEWNYRFNSKQDSQNFNLCYETFVDLFTLQPVWARLILQHLILQGMKEYCLLLIEKKF